MTHSSILEEEIPIQVKKQPWIRVQNNILARPERAILNWLCSHMPNAVTSDPLTAVGVAGAVIVLAGYIGSRFDPAFFGSRPSDFSLTGLAIPSMEVSPAFAASRARATVIFSITPLTPYPFF